jgi:hypothetical protein
MRRIFLGSVIAICSVGLFAPPASSAATTIGLTGTPTGCSSPGYGGQVQTATAGGLTYTVPFDGTITSWSGASNAGGLSYQTELLILQPVSGSTFHVVAKSPVGTFTSSGVQTFLAQIPVHQGQVIGEWGLVCYVATGDSGDQFTSFNGPEPATGTDQNFGLPGPPGNAADLSATVEPNPTGQRAAALAICRKRAMKHNWSHKRLRKCKRKARLLPV